MNSSIVGSLSHLAYRNKFQKHTQIKETNSKWTETEGKQTSIIRKQFQYEMMGKF